MAHLKTILKDHKGARLKDLTRKVQECLSTGDVDTAKDYARLIEKEKGKETWKAIKLALNKNIGEPLTTITVLGNTVT